MQSHPGHTFSQCHKQFCTQSSPILIITFATLPSWHCFIHFCFVDIEFNYLSCMFVGMLIMQTGHSCGWFYKRSGKWLCKAGRKWEWQEEIWGIFRWSIWFRTVAAICSALLFSAPDSDYSVHLREETQSEDCALRLACASVISQQSHYLPISHRWKLSSVIFKEHLFPNLFEVYWCLYRLNKAHEHT